jgi:putative transposase
MARLPRIVIPNAPHHVTQRGNRRQQTFFCKEDYKSYIEIMALACKRYNVSIWAYCLMPNHVHLVAVPQSQKDLTQAIGEAHESYTKQINYRMGWSGHLWQGRFFSATLDDYYLERCVRYVELNPIKSGLCIYPQDYPWSSSKAHCEKKSDRLVDVTPMLNMFPDWLAYLNVHTDASDIDLIRKNSRTGRPIGDKKFLEQLEIETGLRLTPKKPGPVREIDWGHPTDPDLPIS